MSVAGVDLRVPPGPGLPQGLVIPAEELVERFSRSQGPGGQGVNTTDSRVELLFERLVGLEVPSGVEVAHAVQNGARQARHHGVARKRGPAYLQASFMRPDQISITVWDRGKDAS